MKYRRLRQDELQELESDFVKFLAANTVTAQEWVKLKEEEPEKAERLIELFSDIVFDQILERVEYLELKTPKDFRTFQCQEDRIEMLGLLVDGKTEFDFTQNLSPQQMMANIQLSGAKLKMYRGERTYKTDRKLEVFALMEQGALISKKGEMFHTLKNLRS